MLFDRTVRWGICGAGSVVRRWIKGARQVRHTGITAIASGTKESAAAAAAELGIPEVLSFEEMAARKDIDVIYVAVPNTLHKELAVRALRAGKHVLVEKPAAVTASEFREMTAEAEKSGCFLMEAMWTRFFPVMQQIRKCIDSGEIGSVRMLQSSFGFRADPSAGNRRLFDPEQAGGSLLDVGVYSLHFADMIFQEEPVRITGLSSFDTDGLHLQVDEQTVCTAQYRGGELAVMISAVRTALSGTAWIYGTKGHMEIPDFWKPSEVRIVSEKGARTVRESVRQRVSGIEDEGYQYEIAHVNDCIRKGLTESPVMTWEKSISVLNLCDRLREESSRGKHFPT